MKPGRKRGSRIEMLKTGSRPLIAALGLTLAWIAAAPIARAAGADEPIRFNRDVRPILSSKCFACHGIDAKKRKADLRLDLAEGAFADRKKGTAVVAGDPGKSLLWSRINSTDPDQVM